MVIVNKQYLDENKYQKVKKVLIIIGCISLVIAVALLIVLLTVDFEKHFVKPILVMPTFIFGVMIPMVTFTTAFRREMMAFTAQQAMPVAQEGVEKMAPTAGVAAKEIAKGIKEGLKDEEK